MQSFTIQAATTESLHSQLLSFILTENIKPTLALVFCAPIHKPENISSVFQSHNIALCGATTAGEIIDSVILEDSIVCMLFELDEAYFEVSLYEKQDRSMFEISQIMGKKATKRFSNPSVLVLGSGLETDGEAIIKGLKTELGEMATIYGGLAGDNFQMDSTFVFSKDKKSDQGISGIIFDGDKIRMEGLAASGWQPVGIEKTITHAENNVVFTIDDVPALEVYQNYFGFSSELDPRKDIVNTMGVQFPLLLNRDYGKFVIRWPIMANPDNNSLIFAGSLPQGAKVRFSIPPNFDIVKKIIEENEELHEHFPNPDALILFSCKARHVALGPLIKEEVAGLKNLWKAPLIGFFTYGEIGSLTGCPSDFHNETCSLVLLKEIN